MVKTISLKVDDCMLLLMQRDKAIRRMRESVMTSGHFRELSRVWSWSYRMIPIFKDFWIQLLWMCWLKELTWLRTWLVYKRFSRTWANCDHFPAATWRHENIHSRSWIAVGMYETLQHLWWRPRGSKKTASKCGHVCMFSSHNYTRWWNVWWKVGISYTNTFCLFVLAALPDVAR